MIDLSKMIISKMIPSDKVLIAGIDEAGRGPVLGPMVYAIYVMRPGTESNFKDSKQMSPENRKLMFNNMNKCYAYLPIDPLYITTHMMSKTKNLNEIAKEATFLLIKEVIKNYKNIKIIYVDALGTTKDYEKLLNSKFNIKFIVEEKADSKYQPVSAASIVAKVTRDSYIQENVGSGYPSDPITVNYLKNSYKFLGFPKFVRHSWMTIKKYFGVRKGKELLGPYKGFYINKY